MFWLSTVAVIVVFLGVCSGQAPSSAGTGGSNDLLVFTERAMVHIDVTTGQSTSFPKPGFFGINAVDHDHVDNRLFIAAAYSIIFSCNMDGSNITYLRDWTASPSPFTDTLAVASDARLVFFGGTGRQVVKMNVNGEHETVLVNRPNTVQGIAVDHSTRMVFWREQEIDSHLYKMGFDGGAVEIHKDLRFFRPQPRAMDLVNNRMFTVAYDGIYAIDLSHFDYTVINSRGTRRDPDFDIVYDPRRQRVFYTFGNLQRVRMMTPTGGQDATVGPDLGSGKKVLLVL
ncbi:low-density lipoprotein receptor-related protein 1-like [Haliotis asinina]|uniref:low-density lipoprotein receptor-related protein 1-like n=1 Tax=Haliotis asinina TaxID=109174 RepID=UPI0035324C32